MNSSSLVTMHILKIILLVLYLSNDYLLYIKNIIENTFRKMQINHNRLSTQHMVLCEGSGFDSHNKEIKENSRYVPNSYFVSISHVIPQSPHRGKKQHDWQK